MEDDRGGESDSDFASAESEQDHEKLEITDSNSSPKADDVATPMTSSLKSDEETRDKEEVANAVQITDDDAKELTGNTLQDEKLQATEVLGDNSLSDTQHTLPVTSTEQANTQEHAANDNTLNTDSNITSPPSTTSASVAHDVREPEEAEQSQDKVCMMCPCMRVVCMQACVGTSCVA